MLEPRRGLAEPAGKIAVSLRNNKVMPRDSAAAIGTKRSRDARGMPAPFSYAGAYKPSAHHH